MAKKKKRKRRKRGKAQAGGERRKVSASARALATRIARAGPDYIKENFVRIMRDSYKLREEPEFRDLYFDVDRAAEVSVKVMKKYEKRAAEMEKAGPDERQMFYDDMRIEIIDELATPEFRRDFLRRLDRCADRLKSTREVEKMEMALFLPPILQLKEIPWGLCGLVTTIYEETKEKAFREYEEDMELFGDFIEAMRRGADIEEILAMATRPERLAAFTEKLESTPSLRERVARNMDQLMEEVSEAISQGKVKLNLFSDEEILLAYVYLAAYIEEAGIEEATADRQAIALKFVEFVQRSIDEVMTPERAAQMKNHLEELFSKWAHAKGKERRWATYALAVANTLDSWEPYHENPFLMGEYLYRAKQMGSKGRSRKLNARFEEMLEAVMAGREVRPAPPSPTEEGKGLLARLRRRILRS